MMAKLLAIFCHHHHVDGLTTVKQSENVGCCCCRLPEMANGLSDSDLDRRIERGNTGILAASAKIRQLSEEGRVQHKPLTLNGSRENNKAKLLSGQKCFNNSSSLWGKTLCVTGNNGSRAERGQMFGFLNLRQTVANILQ